MPTPIILLPGIMGSRLFFSNSGKFWDPDDKLRMLSWLPIRPFRSDDDNRLTLHASAPAGVIYDTSSNVDQAQSDRGWSTVAWSYYGPLLTSLQNQFGAKGSAYAIGYDWRQDIEWLGGYVAGKIQGILSETGVEKAIVVTHSMGGLVLRSALLSNALADTELATLVHVCIPAAGGLSLYRRMFTGMIQPYDGGSGIGDSAFRLLLGNSRKGFVGNMSGLPGAVELLPSSFFPLDSHGAFWNAELNGMAFNDLYAAQTSPPGLIPQISLAADVYQDLQDRVSDIANFEAFFGNPAVSLHPETWLIYGTGQATETHISFTSGIANPVVDNLGDGTVPQISAMALNLGARALAANVEHSAACADAPVVQQVADILIPYL